MAIWKTIAYPFGLAFLGLLFVSWAGMLAFGPDPRAWFEWQSRTVSALGAGAGMAGYVGGMYGAMKANARLLPRSVIRGSAVGDEIGLLHPLV